MNITKEVVRNVANLARLDLSEKELRRLTEDMEDIITYVDKLNELATDGVEPQSQVIPSVNVFREDFVRESYNRNHLLGNSPESKDGFIKVPNVIE